MSMKGKMTIYEMAKKANVSIATISRAMNLETRPRVAPATLEKIDELVNRLGYTPHLAARHLSKTTFKTIGILMPHHPQIFLEDYYIKILAGVSDAIMETDYQFKIVLLRCRDEKWDKHNFKLSDGVDALVVTHWHAFFSHPSVFEKLNVPCAVVSDPEPKTRVHFVSGNHFQGGRLVAEHLYLKGHRRVGIFTGPLCSVDSNLRVRGFQSYFSEKGISINSKNVVCGEFQEGKAYQVTESFMKKAENISAIFCCNDNMAFGVMKRLFELGIDCPKKISIVGYDNDNKAGQAFPALTTVQVPVYDLAKEAANRALSYLENKNSKEFFYKETLMPVQLIERASVLDRNKK